MARQENKSAHQIGFIIDEEDKFAISERSPIVYVGELIQRILPAERLFKKRPRGNIMFQDLSRPQSHLRVLEISSGQAREPTPKETQSKFAAVVIKTPPLEQKGVLSIAKAVFRAAQQLKRNGPVIVVEKKGKNQDREARNKILKRGGLVERSVLTHPKGTEGTEKGTLLWRGRREKRRPKQKRVNLLKGRLGPWLSKKVWPGVVKESKQAGLEVVSGKEIGDKLRQSTVPPLDISSLKLGFGITIEDSQGRRTRIDTRGIVHEES